MVRGFERARRRGGMSWKNCWNIPGRRTWRESVEFVRKPGADGVSTTRLPRAGRNAHVTVIGEPKTVATQKADATWNSRAPPLYLHTGVAPLHQLHPCVVRGSWLWLPMRHGAIDYQPALGAKDLISTCTCMLKLPRMLQFPKG